MPSKFFLYLPGLLWFLLIGSYGIYLIVTGKPVRRYANFGLYRRNRPRGSHFTLPPPPTPTNWLRAAGVLVIITYSIYSTVDDPDYSLLVFILIIICILMLIIGHIVAYRSRRVL
jgi:hypothetical protein